MKVKGNFICYGNYVDVHGNKNVYLRINKNNYFVADEGDGIYNVFAYADFDEEGYYADHNGENGYHISDFDIVFECRHFEDACRWIDQHEV